MEQLDKASWNHTVASGLGSIGDPECFKSTVLGSICGEETGERNQQSTMVRRKYEYERYDDKTWLVFFSQSSPVRTDPVKNRWFVNGRAADARDERCSWARPSSQPTRGHVTVTAPAGKGGGGSNGHLLNVAM